MAYIFDFKQILSFSTDFHKSPLSKFVEVPPVGAELLHVGGRRDRQTHGQTYGHG